MKCEQTSKTHCPLLHTFYDLTLIFLLTQSQTHFFQNNLKLVLS